MTRYSVNQHHNNADKEIYFFTMGGLCWQEEKISFKLKDLQQPAAKAKKKKKIFLAIKQERIGFLHNENSSFEIDESVSKHNSILAIMRSYLRNWVYGFQAGRKSQGFELDLTLSYEIFTFQLIIKSLSINIHSTHMSNKVL